MKALVFGIACTLFFYLLGAFAVWDFSWPAQIEGWTLEDRMTLLFGYVGFCVVATAISDTV